MTSYISASAIKDFLVCSARYFCRRYHKTQTKLSPAVIRGQIAHEVLETEWKEKDLAMVLADEKMSAYDIGKSDKEKIYHYIENFFIHFSSFLTDKDIIEKSFKIPFQRDVFLVGKWDRLVPDNLVFDWKTGYKTPRTLSYDPQFILYDWAYKKVYSKEPLLYYASLKDGTLVKYREKKDNVILLFDKIIPHMLSQIEQRNFVCEGVLKYNMPCRICLYQEFCWDELVGRDFTSKSS